MIRKSFKTVIPQQTNPPNEDFNHRLRNTMVDVQIQRIMTKSKSKLRNSYSYNTQSIPQQPINKPLSSHFLSASQSPTTIKSLKQTLDSLQKKVNIAKRQLDQRPFKKKQFVNVETTKPNITAKKFYGQQAEYEQSHEKQDISSLQTQRKVIENHSINYINSIPRPKNVLISWVNPYSPRNHNIYYISEVIRSKNQKNSLAYQHISQSISLLRELSQQKALSNCQIQKFKLNLKKKPQYKNKKTLVIDMDETLVHCVQNLDNHHDIKLSIKIKEDYLMEIGINIRPYCMSFLKKMAAKFQIIVFTASHQSYADVVLDALDPERQLIQHRLYREHCYIVQNEIHVKDLRILNRNLNEVVLVDNAAYSYCFQLQNGIPIIPFYEGNDYELSVLQKYLEKMENVGDVRQLNKKMFKLHQYVKFESVQHLINELYIGKVDNIS